MPARLNIRSAFSDARSLSATAGDYKIKAWRESGLLSPSIVAGIIRTIKDEMIAGKTGALPAAELHAVEDKLREILAL